MRRILFKTAFLIFALAALSMLWIFSARSVSLLIDRIGAVKMESRTINHLTYGGTGSNEMLKIEGLPLNTQGRDYKPFPLIFRPDSQQGFVIESKGKTLLLGPMTSHEDKFQIVPQAEDKVFLTVRRSFLSWPTPFDTNFMTGHSPSWKRNMYYVLDWQKVSGEKLEMVWRYEQYFYPGDGWTSGFMTREGVTGLIRVEISP